MGKVIPKADFNRWLRKLSRKYELIGPVKSDLVRYSNFERLEDLELSELPYYSFKRYFFPPKEELFSFSKDRVKLPKVKAQRRIIIGAPLADINALRVMDKIFLGDYKDEGYAERRKNTLLVGYADFQPDEYCFSSSFDQEPCYDLMLHEKGDSFYVEVGSEAGRKLVRGFKEGQAPKKKKMVFQKKLEVKDIKAHYDSPKWDKEAEKCLGCAGCTIICPTCACFNVFDDANFDFISGTRFKEWETCDAKNFTTVAGNFAFRDDRSSRMKHRIYHKMVYYHDSFGGYMCVGCGRCLRVCPVGIDFVKVSNSFKRKK